MVSDEDIAASSYILSFYNDIENLTNSYAGYLNVLVRIKDRYKLEKEIDPKAVEKKIIKLEPEDEQALLEVAEGIRVWIARSYIKMETLQDKIPEMKKGIKDIKELYEKAISSSVIKKEVVENFVLKINKVFVSGVLTDLLIKSKDVYKEFLKSE